MARSRELWLGMLLTGDKTRLKLIYESIHPSSGDVELEINLG
jgi:hypothetical protein